MAQGIIIATPTNHGILHADHAQSVVVSVIELMRRGINVGYANYDGADVAMQRDDLADQFLRSGASHLFFSDSDVAYGSDLIPALLAANKEMVGAVYPHRTLSLKRLGRAVRRGDEWPKAVASSYDYAVTLKDGAREGNLVEVEDIGAGALLIAREVFERIAATQKLASYPSRISTRTIRGFFRRFERESEDFLSEDRSFCKRWRDAGGIVWALPHRGIRHIGTFSHSGGADT